MSRSLRSRYRYAFLLAFGLWLLEADGALAQQPPVDSSLTSPVEPLSTTPDRSDLPIGPGTTVVGTLEPGVGSVAGVRRLTRTSCRGPPGQHREEGHHGIHVSY